MPTTHHLHGHVAHLDALTGSGLLVLPRPDDDVPDPFPAVALTLRQAQRREALRALDAMGWEPSEGDDGGWCWEGVAADGRQLVGLYGRDPISTAWDVTELAAVWGELHQLAMI
ncbi:MAG: hypothetical protein HGA44_20710 [Cellulomonadaceae bacterium]|nr:hypothetical protein [Cellulomonadaceae bacterium]